MPKLFVAPIENPRAHSDLERSLLNAVERQTVIRSFSDATYPELIEIERRGRGFYAWGLPPGPENIEKWFHMGVGDVILVGYKNNYHHYAKVLGRYENSRAADAIWGQPENGEGSREFLFFLSEPIPLSLPYAELTDYLPARYADFEQLPAATVDRIEADFGSLDRFIRRRLLNTGAGGPILDMSGIIQMSERDQERLKNFDQSSSKEARSSVVDSIIQRRGHPDFRKRLLSAYDFKCAITGSDAVDALEAAYIIPFRGRFTHHPTNGLLLRADIHTLFDLGKIAVDTRTLTVIVSEDLMATNYRILAGRPITYPTQEEHRPSTESLDLHRRLAGL
jgi:hypothetical protein